MLSTSLIISTYNRPDALSLCLNSVLRQKVMPLEVIVGDDGSREETKQVIDRFKRVCPVPVHHIWHEDRGFRLAMMRNKCIAKAKGEYIIQIDGDLVLNKYFVADHIRFAHKGRYIKGGRVNVKKDMTRRLCSGETPATLTFFSPGLKRRLNAVHCPFLSGILAKRRTHPALGCNLSYFKEDAVIINGYDEFFEGWGAEDSDFVTRLLSIGIKKTALKFSAIAFHLWHKDLYMANEEKNYAYFHQNSKRHRCENGLSKYLESSK